VLTEVPVLSRIPGFAGGSGGYAEVGPAPRGDRDARDGGRSSCSPAQRLSQRCSPSLSTQASPPFVVLAAANRDPAIFAEHRADLGGQCFQGHGPDASDLRQTPATVNGTSRSPRCFCAAASRPAACKSPQRRVATQQRKSNYTAQRLPPGSTVVIRWAFPDTPSA
jgi:hypothetical protein